MRLAHVFKRVVIFFLSRMPSRLSTLSVLMYHSVSDSRAFFSVGPQEFERQVHYIRDSGLETIFASAIMREVARATPRGAVCITFDDGYEDVYANAFPLLQRYGIKATVFLITSQIGGTYTNSEGRTFTLLSESQIREMQESGIVEFMPHGHTHRKLTALSEVEQLHELAQSRDIVRSLTGKEPNVFAYPRGRMNPEIAALVAERGFTHALGVVPGLVRPSSPSFDMPRNAVDRHTTFAEFKLKLSDSIERYHALSRII